MTTYKQDKQFVLSKMGTTPGMCLGNVRSAFGIPCKYHSAKEAMEAAKKAGHLHPINTRPTNCAVPVFADTSSPYEHAMVYDHDTLYSDGAKVINPEVFSYFGWSESLNDVRIVSPVEEDKPTPTPGKPALKTNEQIADEVIAGKWGNGQERKDRLTKAGYNYGVIQAIVNQKCGKPAQAGLKVGDTVRITRWVDYYGRPLRQMSGTYKIYQLNGDRAVVTRNGGVYAAINVNNLRKA